MSNPAIALRLDDETRSRVEKIANCKQQTVSATIRDALNLYLQQAEQEQKELEEAQAALLAFEQDGLHLNSEETLTWLATWGTAQEHEAPKCHN